jgi:hypothetical protein
MSDFLGRLAERTLGVAEAIQPRIAPLYAAGASPPIEQTETTLRSRPESTPPRVNPASPSSSPDAPSWPVVSDTPPDVEVVSNDRPPDRTSETPAQQEEPTVQPVPTVRDVQPGVRAERLPEDRRSPPALLVPSRPRPEVTRVVEQHALDGSSPLRADPAPALPTVRVTIGRIEVRAVYPAPQTPRPTPAAPRPALTLEQYREQRRGGER